MVYVTNGVMRNVRIHSIEDEVNDEVLTDLEECVLLEAVATPLLVEKFSSDRLC